MRTVLNIIVLLLLGLALAVGSLYEADRSVESLSSRWMLPESRFVDVGGMRVHVAVQGKGPVLVLLHGTGASLHTWNGWVEALAPHFRVVRMDLPGFGLTGPHPADDYSIDAYVAFLRDLAATLDVERFHLAGNSLGGQIAWNYAARFPDRVERLILVDPSGYPRKRAPSLVFRLAAIPVLGDVFAKLTPRSLFRRSLEEVYADDSKVSDELVERYFELSLREGNREALQRRLRAAATQQRDPAPMLAEIMAPTLVQWGAKDAWIPLSDGARFARDIPDARLVVYPELGHVPMEEAPARTAADALAFLGGD